MIQEEDIFRFKPLSAWISRTFDPPSPLPPPSLLREFPETNPLGRCGFFLE